MTAVRDPRRRWDRMSAAPCGTSCSSPHRGYVFEGRLTFHSGAHVTRGRPRARLE
jgi:hypothetical protein